MTARFNRSLGSSFSNNSGNSSDRFRSLDWFTQHFTVLEFVHHAGLFGVVDRFEPSAARSLTASGVLWRELYRRDWPSLRFATVCVNAKC